MVATTTQPWQFAALCTLLGEPEEVKIKYFSVTLKGLKPGVYMKWPRETLNRLVEESGWVKSVMPGVEKFDDLIRLDWRSVAEAVEKARNELAPLVTCGGRQCGGKFNDMLRELKNFVADAERWAMGKMSGKEADKFYKRARKYLAPALALLLLQNAGTDEERRNALWHLGLILTTTVAGDGYVARRQIHLTSGEGGPALLWLAALKKAGFKPTLRVEGNYYRLDFAGGDAVVLAAVMPAVGINPKAEEAVDMFREEAEKGGVKVDIQPPVVQKPGKYAVATITVRAGPWEEEYRLYLKDKISLRFRSTDADRVYQAAHLLSLLGMKTEPRKEGDRDVWYIYATANALADKRVLPAFREALAKAVEEAKQRGLVKAEKAERWIKKLREGVTTAEDKPMFNIQITNSGLYIAYYTTSGERLRQYASLLEGLGLEEGTHFTVKKPEGVKRGRLHITVKGVVKLAELAKHAEDPELRAKAGEWINHLLERARESGGEEARKKLEELVEEGAARGALKLIGKHEVVERGAKVKHSVVVKHAEAKPDGDKLRIHVKATVDGVEVKRTWTFFRYHDRVRGYVLTRADAPGGRAEDARRLQILSKVIFGDAGTLKSNGKQILYTRRHLEHAMRFKEIKDEIERWTNR